MAHFLFSSSNNAIIFKYLRLAIQIRLVPYSPFPPSPNSFGFLLQRNLLVVPLGIILGHGVNNGQDEIEHHNDN